MGLLARVVMGINGALTKAVGIGGQIDRNFSYGAPLEYKDGVGANQASKIYAMRQTINASTNLDLDLSGTLVNELGDAVVFTAVKAILVRPISGPNPAVVAAAGAANPFVGPFGGPVSVPQGGEMCIGRTDAGGWPVGAGASDILRISNAAGGAIDVDVVVVGI